MGDTYHGANENVWERWELKGLVSEEISRMKIHLGMSPAYNCYLKLQDRMRSPRIGPSKLSL